MVYCEIKEEEDEGGDCGTILGGCPVSYTGVTFLGEEIKYVAGGLLGTGMYGGVVLQGAGRCHGRGEERSTRESASSGIRDVYAATPEFSFATDRVEDVPSSMYGRMERAAAAETNNTTACVGPVHDCGQACARRGPWWFLDAGIVAAINGTFRSAINGDSNRSCFGCRAYVT